jgi:hypothetical protein
MRIGMRKTCNNQTHDPPSSRDVHECDWIVTLVTRRISANDPDQRGPGVEHPFVKTDHRSSVASDGYPPRSVSERKRTSTHTAVNDNPV